MRTIAAPSAETGDAFEGIYPDITLPRAGDPVVVYCRETRRYFDGQVTGATWYAYSVLVGEKRSGRFKRRKRQRIARASGPSNAARGEKTRRRIVELLEHNGGSMPAPKMARELGITRDAIRWHALRGLKRKLRGYIGPNRHRWWELVA